MKNNVRPLCDLASDLMEHGKYTAYQFEDGMTETNLSEYLDDESMSYITTSGHIMVQMDESNDFTEIGYV
jgi:hypothetical protein